MVVYNKCSEKGFRKMDQYVTDKDIGYEYSIVRDPNNINVWLQYILEKKNDPKTVSWLYERCLMTVPVNWDIWKEYLEFRIQLLSNFNEAIHEKEYGKINKLFQSCLESCFKIVEAWKLYLNFVIRQRNLTMIRKVLNKALVSLPLEFHQEIWNILICFLEDILLNNVEDVPELDLTDLIYNTFFNKDKLLDVEINIWASHILNRFFKVTDDIGRLIPLLQKTHDYERIIVIYDQYKIIKNAALMKTNLNVIYMNYITALDHCGKTDKLETIILDCITNFPENSVNFIIFLSKHYLKKMDMKRFVSFLQDQLNRTMEIKEFSKIYDYFVLFEETFLEIIIEQLKINPSLQASWEQNLNFHVELLDSLVSSYKLKLNDLKLRQDSNNIQHWLTRSSLFSTPQDKARVFSEAILQINHKIQVVPGEFGKLWCQYADIYIKNRDYDTARQIFDKGLNVPFKFLLDLEVLWIKWSEMELDINSIDSAINVLETALKIPNDPDLLQKTHINKVDGPAQTKLFTSLKLWSLLIDMLESQSENSSFFEKTLETYELMIKLKVATPITFINYAYFLQDHNLFEKSFTIYERAISIFPPEIGFEIWNVYLAESIKFKLPVEQMRELFENSLKLSDLGIDCKPFFILYSEFEKKNEMFTRSIDILHRGCLKTNDIESKCILWELCIINCKKLLGVECVKELYEECIQLLPNSKAIHFVLDFAKLEEQLKEFEKCKTILRFGARLIHPSKNLLLWDYWSEFELRHGDKETYKDMLKMRREMEETFKVDSKNVSKKDGNIEFTSPKDLPSTSTNKLNPQEIELNL